MTVTYCYSIGDSVESHANLTHIFLHVLVEGGTLGFCQSNPLSVGQSISGRQCSLLVLLWGSHFSGKMFYFSGKMFYCVCGKTLF